MATLLCERGYRVALLEKEVHPRFHIGESLLPANLPLFEKLGVADEIRAIGMVKLGATFVSPWHDDISGFRFADGIDKSLPSAYQVRRSQFDEILFRRATRAGADAREGVRVREADLGTRGSGVRVSATDRAGAELEWSARFLVDATGRDTFLGNRLKIKQRNPKHASAAIFGHFRNARRDTGETEGNIIIAWFEHGWFWFIPLKDGITSVGAVAWPYYLNSRNKRPVRDFLMETIALCPEIADRLKDAELAEEPTATGNYSYDSRECQGENFLMIGDAFAFVDPMFSSGVMLAMNSAFEAAAVLEARFKGDERAEQKARARFDWAMRHGPREFSWFIYRVTNPNLRDMFMSPRENWVKAAVVSVLAGDLFRGTPIRRGLLAFRSLYYLTSLADVRRSLAAWRRRAFNIDDRSVMRSSRG